LRATLLAALAALGGAVPGAAQERFDRTPIAPGFWAFPHQAGDDLASSCRTGFTLRLGDGRALSFLIEAQRSGRGAGEGARLVVDSVERCEFDAARQAELCTGRLREGRTSAEYSSETRFQRDGERRLMALTTVRERRPGRRRVTEVVSYPAPCPDEAVQDVLTRGLPSP
jgi:hypothetical protein